MAKYTVTEHEDTPLLVKYLMMLMKSFLLSVPIRLDNTTLKIMFWCNLPTLHLYLLLQMHCHCTHLPLLYVNVLASDSNTFPQWQQTSVFIALDCKFYPCLMAGASPSVHWAERRKHCGQASSQLQTHKVQTQVCAAILVRTLLWLLLFDSLTQSSTL